MDLPPTCPPAPPRVDPVVVAGGLAAGGAALAGATLAAVGGGAGGLAALLVLAALLAVVAAPWRAALLAGSGPADPSARGRAAAAGRATAEAAAVLAGLGLAAAAGVREGLGAAALGGALLVLALAAAAALGAAALGRHGQALASGLGLAAVGLPYLAGPALAAAPPALRPPLLELALLSPVPALAGSVAGVDVLRGEVLYHGFPLGQALPYAYARPGAVALAAAALVLLAAAAAGLRGILAGRVQLALPPAPALALLLALLAPGAARAQLVPTPAGTGEPVIGDLQTRVQLGYWVPQLEGYVQKAGFDGQVPSGELSLSRVLDLDPIFVLPTFEIQLKWANAGVLSGQYLEAGWRGEIQTGAVRRYEELVIDAGSFINTKYYFRSIAFAGELHIPILDFITLRIMLTTRYMKHEIKMQVQQPGGRFNTVRSSAEAFVPVLGAGVDAMVWGPIAVYGSMQWLDFRTDMFGSTDEFEFKYTEWAAGVRLELVEQAHVMLEWFQLTTSIEQNTYEEYHQDLFGPRIQVAVLF